MTPYSDLWGKSGPRETGARNSMWPGARNYASSGTPAPSQYSGYYADRQSRFYLRSLRRDGVFFVDFLPVFLWFDDDWAPLNGYCL